MENRSDHSPVYAVFDSIHVIQDAGVPAASKPRPSWHLACDCEQIRYKIELEAKLNLIDIPPSVTELQNRVGGAIESD